MSANRVVPVELGQSSTRRKVANAVKLVILYVVLIFIAVVFFLPIIWMVLTSFKTDPQAYRYPPVWWPDPWVFTHYIEANQVQPLGRIYLNSLFVTTTIILGQLVTSSMSGFAFSRIQFKGRDVLFLAYLATMMVPFYVRLIPLYLIIKRLNLLDTYTALILPWLAVPYGTFLLRQFFMGIPMEYEDAARIEGLSTFRIFLHVIIPLSKTAIITLATLTFPIMWNQFIWPVVVISTSSRKTLPAAVALFSTGGQTGAEWTMLMSVSTIIIIPILILFLVSQKFFVRGIVLTGLK